MRYFLILCFAWVLSHCASAQYYPTKQLKKWLKNGSYEWVPDSLNANGGFWIADGELENLSWMEYMYAMKKVDSVLYNASLPDTTVWREKLSYNEPYVDYYLRHPAYYRYPVVGITKQQAIDYCKHMSNYMDTAFNGMMSAGPYTLRFRLPTEREWELAARGGNPDNKFGYEGNSLTRTDKKFEGQYCSNHLRFSQGSIEILPDSTLKLHGFGGRAQYMGVAGHLNDNADVTAPTESYWPNAYGIYNMSGNVSEMVIDRDVVKGGSWRNPPYYLQIDTEQAWNPEVPNSTVGCRIIVEIDKR